MNFPVKMTRILKKLATFSQILGIPTSTSKPTLVQKFSRMEVYSALALPILYTEEIWKRRKEDKKNDIN